MIVDIKSGSHATVPELVIDSGAASNVAGKEWILAWRKWGNVKEPLVLGKSSRKFRFGSGVIHPSEGTIELKGWLWINGKVEGKRSKREFNIVCDVVNLPIPLLLSLNALRLCNCMIHFGEGKLIWKDQSETKLKMTMDKHMSFEWYPIFGPNEGILVEDEVPPETIWGKSRLEKFHLQLGHADVGVMKRILNYAGEKAQENSLQDVTRTCGCQVNTGIPQPPRISKYVANYPGEVIALDVFYPSGSQTEPAIICVDALTRYVSAKFLTSLRPRTIISFLITCWIALMGVPVTVMVDRGTPFMGSDWDVFSHSYGIKIVTAPTRAHYQLGLAERNSSLLKTLFMAQSRENPMGWTKTEILSLTCLARNLSPSVKTGMTPLQLLTGRNDMVARLLNAVPPVEESGESNATRSYESLIWPRIKLLLDLRMNAIKADAKQIVDLALAKNLRAHVAANYKYGDSVQLYDDQSKTWQGTYKMIFDSGRNCYVEKGAKVIKQPTHWTRKLSDREEYKEPGNPQKVRSMAAQGSNDGRLEKDKETRSTKEIGGESKKISPVFVPWKKYHLRSASQINLADPGILEDALCGGDLSTIQSIFSAQAVKLEKKQDEGEQLRQTILDSHGIVDLSRLTPKIYLPLKAGRQALRDEIYGILRKDKSGVPVGEIFKKGDTRWKNVPWVMTTVVTKIKTDGTVKSRLCLRGDRIPTINQPFASAPTVSRDFLKIFCGLFVNFRKFSWVQVDISKAFTQSDLFNDKDRIAARLPDFIGINGRQYDGHVAISNKAELFEKGVRSEDPNFFPGEDVVAPWF